MGRIYYATGGSTQATAGDIMGFDTPATGMMCLHELVITISDTETDDSTEILIVRATTAGSSGTAITPRPALVGSAASGVTVREHDTTDATTLTNIYREGMSILAGFQKIWTPETRIWVPPSSFLIVKFVGNITSATMLVTAIFEEFD